MQVLRRCSVRDQLSVFLDGFGRFGFQNRVGMIAKSLSVIAAPSPIPAAPPKAVGFYAVASRNRVKLSLV
jgi:hypothetical protein